MKPSEPPSRESTPGSQFIASGSARRAKEHATDAAGPRTVAHYAGLKTMSQRIAASPMIPIAASASGRRDRSIAMSSASET
jgi:hypothetical protein